MKYLLFYIFYTVLVFSCNSKIKPNESNVAEVKSTTKDSAVPSCIQYKIDSIKSQPVWNPPAEIHEYEYNGKRMFAMSAPCCDFFNTVFDENCNYICAPSGGFTGRGDGKCTDFFKVGKHVRLIWKDERDRK
ncbi:MAG TPA: hypothetical protein VF623_02770 [Segetibacter sp.]